MKAKKQTGIAAGANSHWPRDTQREIRNFMRALSSYPERFADDPYVSFEQHLSSLASTSPAGGESSRQS